MRRLSVRTLVKIVALVLILTLTPIPEAFLSVSAATLAEPALQQTVYIVQAGDTLSALALRFGTTVQAIMAANGLTSTRIYIGQRLIIPGATPSQPVRYQVQWGDTLSKIALRFNTTVQAIMSINGLTSSRIYAGQWLTIPSGGGAAAGRELIQFAPGAISATRHGMLRFPTHIEYVLRALQGQTMYVQVDSADGSVNFAVQGLSDGIPLKRLVDESRSWTGTLPMTQDYQIDVATTSVSSVAYTLYVQVDPLPGPVSAERIRFAPGTISATRTGILAPQQMKQYVLRAKAGQAMLVVVTSPSSLINFSLQGVVDGQLYKRAEVGEPRLDMTLPMTQDYRISVINFDEQSAVHTLYVQIDP